MPKVFRPKITQSSGKPPSNDPITVTSPTDPSPISLSPVRASDTNDLTLPLALEEQQQHEQQPTTPLPSAQPPVHPPTSHVCSPITVDIDVGDAQRRQSLSVPDIPVDLFTTKKIKRLPTKHIVDPLPDPDKPLDRSTVSLRSLLRWNPVHKPPPSYRQEGATPLSSGDAASKQNASIVSDVVPKQEACFKTENAKPLVTASETPSQNVDVLAPQLRLDADGNIVLDETSLLVSIPSTPHSASDVKHVTEETGILSVTYNSFRPPQARRGCHWKRHETLRFYRALSTIGQDFYLMCKLFPTRSRVELKRKFKRENKDHPYLINQALRSRRHYDLTALIPSSDVEEDDEEDVKLLMPPTVKSRVRHHRGKEDEKLLPLDKLSKQIKRSTYDPSKVNKTIDAVLAQINAESVSLQSLSLTGVIRNCESDSDHRIATQTRQTRHRKTRSNTQCNTAATQSASSASTSTLLQRMIAHKQAEVQSALQHSDTVPSPSPLSVISDSE